ncbi:MAG: hypothetical protein JRJ85_01060 [Deltaproteobacteria bacterium]|nr:hypothetical protein [Deltaproteobacteria bacterium]
MNAVIFLGPTLSRREASAILDAEYLPPAENGDIINLIHRKDMPDAIGIVDGVELPGPSVWHMEVLYALSLGIPVYGAGAFGALRAKECEMHGMRGIGRVFNWIRSLDISSDDEVLCGYEKIGEEYFRTSEPFVNLKATFDLALEKEVIVESIREQLLTAIRGIHYKQRSMSIINSKFKQLNISKHVLYNLNVFVKSNYVDIQAEDARQLLKTISMGSPVGKSAQHRSETNFTHIYHALYERYRKVNHNLTQMRLYDISNYVFMNHPDIAGLYEQSMNRALVLMLARILDINPTKEEIEEQADRFRRKWGLTDKDPYEAWLRNNDLSMIDFNELMADLARVRKLQKWLSIRNGFSKTTKTIVDQLRLSNQYENWKRKTAERERILKDKKNEITIGINQENVAKMLIQHIVKRQVSLPDYFMDLLQENGLGKDILFWELVKEDVAKKHLTQKAIDLFD